MRLGCKLCWIGLLASSLAMSLYGALLASSPSVSAAGWQSDPQTSMRTPGSDKDLRLKQNQQDVDTKSAGCQSCHQTTDSTTMHASPSVRLGCTDCHGGDATVRVPASLSRTSKEYEDAKKRAHPWPRVLSGDASANPARAYTSWLKEDWNYIKFVNPGDLRVAAETCGTSGCHAPEVQKVRMSMMTHGAMLWGAALYNN